ncbi:MAG: glucose-6-phosphate isomerase [Gaiellales bacterium]|nr:MAG: glucose-6-phosphate isomerase [Gaiellales bacterium]
MKGYYASVAADSVLERLEEDNFVERLWQRDPAIWPGDEAARRNIGESLGWLGVVEAMQGRLDELDDFTREVREAGFEQVVHMGMGGSSLAPLVFERTFGPQEDWPELSVLDTTDPTTVIGVAGKVPMGKTLFIVASKSGTTAEPLAFGEYFYKGVGVMAEGDPGDNFAVITDPGTPLEQQAYDRSYRRVFLNFADIGGRYSALSWFGLVPVALMGIDVRELLLRAAAMARDCRRPAPDNPGVALGALMGDMARRGRDKLTLVMPASIATLGVWLEQLIAESTGKQGAGIIPVAGEPLGSPDDYGDDRLFVYLRLAGDIDPDQEDLVGKLEAAGQPVVRVELEDAMDLGREFMRWEVATATAGAVLGINPFDQPNVQESKDYTNLYLRNFREQGGLPEEEPALTEGHLQFYTETPSETAAATLAAFFSQAAPGDYLAVLAYLTESAAASAAIDAVRKRVRDALGIAATSGYGPRYLHSTGQLHKGGPGSGLYLLLTADEERDALIPGEPFTFAVFKQAQALGDLDALRKHGRRVLRVHLGPAGNGLSRLDELLGEALTP